MVTEKKPLPINLQRLLTVFEWNPLVNQVG